MKRIRIAQIGTSTNSHGNDIFNTLKNHSDVFDIAGYAFPENEREKFPHRMKDFDGYTELTIEQILSDPTIDAVTVENEEIYLTKYALMAAEAGKHMHMEKPGGMCLTDFEKLINTVKANNTVFHVGYMYRYNPYISELIKQVKNGELGDIISVEAQMNCLHDDSVRKWLAAFKGGMMFFLGCHLIDLILQIQGKPERIIPMNKASGKNGIDSEDYGMAVFEYKNGVSFAKTADIEYGGYARRQLVVTGTKKTVVLEPLEMFGKDGLFTDKVECTNPSWGDAGVKTRSAPYDRYADMMLSFGKMVSGDIVNPYTYDYELELYKTVLECCGYM